MLNSVPCFFPDTGHCLWCCHSSLKIIPQGGEEEVTLLSGCLPHLREGKDVRLLLISLVLNTNKTTYGRDGFFWLVVCPIQKRNSQSGKMAGHVVSIGRK